MDTGERIKNRRKEIGMTADNLALELGVSRSTIYRYESGFIEKLPLDFLEPLADALNTTPDYLMGWTDDPIDYDEPVITGDIPLEILKEADGDMELAYKMHQAVLNDSQRNSINSVEIENPDIRQIARAGKKMTPEQAENLRKYAEFMYPEAFKNGK